MSDFVLFIFLFFIAYPVLTLTLMWQLRLYGILGAAIASAISILIIAAAMVLSVSDIAGADENSCDRLFTVVHEERDPDGNTWWSIRVTPYMQDNGTDGMCQWFGECVLALIESSPSMGAIEIVNPENEWVPSQWRVIDGHKAMLLAGKMDYEEFGHAYGFVEVHYGD